MTLPPTAFSRKTHDTSNIAFNYCLKWPATFSQPLTSIIFVPSTVACFNYGRGGDFNHHCFVRLLRLTLVLSCIEIRFVHLSLSTEILFISLENLLKVLIIWYEPCRQPNYHSLGHSSEEMKFSQLSKSSDTPNYHFISEFRATHVDGVEYFNMLSHFSLVGVFISSAWSCAPSSFILYFLLEH